MKVMAKARQTFRSGRTKTISFRKTQLRELYRFMTEQEAAIKQALYDCNRSRLYCACVVQIPLVYKQTQYLYT